MSPIQLRSWAVHGVAIGAVLCAAGGARSAIGREYLEVLVERAPVIVIAEVNSVEGLQGGDWKATARVIETLKGPKHDVVSYGPAVHGDAAGCDVSMARVGEVVVLLLEPERSRISDVLRIAYDGNGRLPILAVNGSRFIESYVRPDAPMSRINIDGTSRVVVPVEWLRELVSRKGPESPNE